jgi:general stress protein 26
MARVTDPRMSDTTTRETLAERVRDIRYCMFTTVDAAGTLRARPLTVLEMGLDGTLWFFIAASGEVAREVSAHPQVSLALSDPGDNRYVALSGSAYLVQDREKVEALWNTMAGAWFPGGPDDPNLALMRVDVDEAGYWEPEGTKIGQFVSIYKAALTRTRPKDEGEHHRVTF